MNNLTKTLTTHNKLELFQSVLNCTKEEIKEKTRCITESCGFMHITENNLPVEVMEIRLPDATLSCYIPEETQLCDNCYLFPDDEEEVENYKEICDSLYLNITIGQWVNQENSCSIRIIQDRELGSIIHCLSFDPN